MVRELKNQCVIEGILSEIALDEGTFTRGDGTSDSYIRGFFKVQVAQAIEGKEAVLDIPVHVYAVATTKKGGSNPSYASLKTVIDSFKSIAAVGIEEADKIRVTGARVDANEFISLNDGSLISRPRIMGSFVSRVKAEDFKPRAVWEVELYINKMDYVHDNDGVETDTYQIDGIYVGYNERAFPMSIITRSKKNAEAIARSYGVGDTIWSCGHLNFTSNTQTYFEEVEIGDPIEKRITTFVNEFVLSGIRSLSDGLSKEDIEHVAALRMKRLEDDKEKSMQRETTRQSGETAAPSGRGKVDLGF